jgi:hypothetical protein
MGENSSPISMRVFFLLKFGNQSIKIGGSVLVYECKAMPGTGTAKKTQFFERDYLVGSYMGMILFPFCPIALPIVK